LIAQSKAYLNSSNNIGEQDFFHRKQAKAIQSLSFYAKTQTAVFYKLLQIQTMNFVSKSRIKIDKVLYILFLAMIVPWIAKILLFFRSKETNFS
jgi:hypothetical protein